MPALSQEDLVQALNQENRALADRIEELLAHIQLGDGEIEREQTQLREQIAELEADGVRLEQENQEQSCLITELTRKTEDDLNTIMDLQQRLVEIGQCAEESQGSGLMETFGCQLQTENTETLSAKSNLEECVEPGSSQATDCTTVGSVFSLKKEEEELTGSINSLREEHREVALSVQMQTEEKQRLTRTVWGLKEEKDNITRSLSDLKQEREQLTRTICGLRDEREQFIRSMSGLKEEKEQLATSLSCLQREKEKLFESLSSEKEERDQTVKSLQRLQRDGEQLSQTVLSLEQERDELTESLKRLREQREREQSLHTSEEERNNLRESVCSLKHERDEIEHSIARLKQEQKQIALSLERLREERGDLQAAGFPDQSQPQGGNQTLQLFNQNHAAATKKTEDVDETSHAYKGMALQV